MIMEQKLQERYNWPHDSLDIEQLANLETVKNRYIPRVVAFLRRKAEFWSLMLRLQNRENTSALLEKGLKLSTEALNISADFSADIANMGLQYS